MFTTQKIADTYDQIGLNFSATREKLSPEVVSLLPNLPRDATILDLGCGNGILLTALPTTISYTGIDISPVLTREATGLHPEHRFMIADITSDTTWTDLPRYHFIVALAVFHHLPTPDDHIKLLRNIKQHLKPNGTVLISVWRLDLPKFDRYRRGKYLSIPFHRGLSRDFYAFTDDELTNLAKQTGFANIKTTTIKDNLYLTLSP